MRWRCSLLWHCGTWWRCTAVHDDTVVHDGVAEHDATEHDDTAVNNHTVAHDDVAEHDDPVKHYDAARPPLSVSHSHVQQPIIIKINKTSHRFGTQDWCSARNKAEKTPKQTPTGPSSLGNGSSNTGVYGSPSDPGAILAFSWACNQAVVNDSLLKCPFCDTPFISKGAYRHHLSKMHFVKDGASPDPKVFMNNKNSSSSTPPSTEKSPRSTPGGVTGGDSSASTTKEENAQSKFQKYSQLAKQLSCSSQP